MLGMPGAAPQRTHLGLAEVGEPVGLLQAELFPARTQAAAASDGALVRWGARGVRAWSAPRVAYMNLIDRVGRRAGARAAVGTAVSESIAFAMTEV